jgi:antitoxin ParD1/3/4
MASQSSMNISLPDDMRQWVDDQIKADGFGTASEYVRPLIREAQKRKAREWLDQKLIRALDSGEPAALTPSDWDHVRAAVRERLAAKASSK